MLPKTGYQYDTSRPLVELVNFVIKYLRSKIQSGDREYRVFFNSDDRFIMYLDQEFGDLFREYCPGFLVEFNYDIAFSGTVNLVLEYIPDPNTSDLARLFLKRRRHYRLPLGIVEVEPCRGDKMFFAQIVPPVGDPSAELPISFLLPEMSKAFLKDAEADFAFAQNLAPYFDSLTPEQQAELQVCADTLFEASLRNEWGVPLEDLMDPKWRATVSREIELMQCAVS